MATVDIVQKGDKNKEQSSDSSSPRTIIAPQLPGFSNQLFLIIAAPLVTTRGVKMTDLRPLSSREELSFIADAIEPFRIAFDVAIRFARADRPIAFSQNDQPVFLHIATHGILSRNDAAFVAEAPGGDEVLLNTPGFLDLLRNLPTRTVQVALLNVCHSQQLARALVALDIPHVVAINADEAVLEYAGRIFSRVFYHEVLIGNSIAESFNAARQAVYRDFRVAAQGSNVEEYLKIQLHPQDVPHGDSISISGTEGRLRVPPWTRTNLVPICNRPLVGRQIDIFKLNRKLLNASAPSLVVVRGAGGIGKTVFAESAARWQHERAWWVDGVWKIEAREVSTARELRGVIAARLCLPPELAKSDLELAGWLKDKKLLLILDDLDRLVREDRTGLRTTLGTFLGYCERLTILATLRHEHELPDIGYHTQELKRIGTDYELEALKAYLKKDLWADSKGRFRSDLKKLLALLDGYPLAIKLAAAYMHKNAISVTQMIERLTDRPMEAFREQGTREDRDNSLRKALKVSFEALPNEPHDFYSLLACFPAGITDSFATKICGQKSVKYLEEIHSYSMAELDIESDGDVVVRRFRLLWPAQCFAESHLEDIGIHNKHGQMAVKQYAEFAKRHCNSIRESQDGVRRIKTDLRYLESENDIEESEAELEKVVGALNVTRNILVAEYPNIRYWLEWALANLSKSVLESFCNVICEMTTLWSLTPSGDPFSAVPFLRKAESALVSFASPLVNATVQEALGDLCKVSDREAAKRSFMIALSEFEKAKVKGSAARLHEKLSRIDSSNTDEHLKQASSLYLAAKDKDAAARCYEMLSACQLRNGDSVNARDSLLLATKLYTVPVQTFWGFQQYARAAQECGNTVEETYGWTMVLDTGARHQLYRGLLEAADSLVGIAQDGTRADIMKILSVALERATRDDQAGVARRLDRLLAEL